MTFRDRRQKQYFVLRLENIALLHPGEYWIELFCDGQFIDDANFNVLEEGPDDV